MRLPFTDQFLWDLYNFLGQIGDIYDFSSHHTFKEAWSPELRKFRREYEKKQNRKKLSQLIYYLKKKGYIKIKNLKQKQAVLITKQGKDKILKIVLKTKHKKRRSDGKWQMIIFDIPEKKKQFREILRGNLYLLGYKKLQQSVWVCPYDVLKETEDIIGEYSLDSYVKLFLIEEIEM